MITEITQNYLVTAALLRNEIALLRSKQKDHPETSRYYEQQIILLFEEYSRLLDVSTKLMMSDLQEDLL